MGPTHRVATINDTLDERSHGLVCFGHTVIGGGVSVGSNCVFHYANDFLFWKYFRSPRHNNRDSQIARAAAPDTSLLLSGIMSSFLHANRLRWLIYEARIASLAISGLT